jgi:hypothetical protein
MIVRALVCDGCSARLEFGTAQYSTGRRYPTIQMMEQRARDQGWNAPDKAGRHWCTRCRRAPRPRRSVR